MSDWRDDLSGLADVFERVDGIGRQDELTPRQRLWCTVAAVSIIVAVVVFNVWLGRAPQ